MTNETKKPTRCSLTETILKRFFPELNEPDGEDPGYTETFLGTIMTFPSGGATLIVDPELLDEVEWSDPNDPGARIELPEGYIETSHDRPEEIAAIIDTLIINAIQQEADRTQIKRKRARDNFMRIAEMEAEKHGIKIGIFYEYKIGDAEPWDDEGREAKWYGWGIFNHSSDLDPLPCFAIPPIDFSDKVATNNLMLRFRFWLKQQAK